MPFPPSSAKSLLDASDGDHVNPNTDNGAVVDWTGELGATKAFPTGDAPIFRALGSPMTWYCVEFDGVDDYMGLYSADGSTPRTIADLVATSTHVFDLWLAFRLIGATRTGGSPWDLEHLVGDFGGYFGVSACQPSSGNYEIRCWMNSAVCALPVSLNTDYVLHWTNDGTTQSANVNGGTPAAAAGGTFGSTAGSMRFGRGYSAGAGGPARFDMGEFMCCSTILAGTDLSGTNTEFGKWLAPGPPRTPPSGGLWFGPD